jgi:hypothetical protein
MQHNSQASHAFNANVESTKQFLRLIIFYREIIISAIHTADNVRRKYANAKEKSGARAEKRRWRGC